MKEFVQLIIATAGLILITPVLHSSDLNGFQLHSPSDRELIEKDVEYLQNLNERVDELLRSGEMDSIRYMVDEALHLAELFNNREAEAKAYLNLGSYFLNRNLPDSVFYHVAEPYERLKDTSHGLFLGNIIANAHMRSNSPTASLILQEELLERAKAEENTYFIAGITQNMANNYKNIGDLNTAIELYLISLEMVEEMADSTLLTVVLDNLGGLNSDLVNINSDIMSDFEKVANDKNITIENHLPETALVYADKQMVYVILRNLISNALKYTPKSGKVILGFKLSNERATYSVEDNGEGIPLEYQDYIFNPFHTSNMGTDGEVGTGLGLAICKDFAEIQGADVYFESVSGKGTTFFVDFKIPPIQNSGDTMDDPSHSNSLSPHKLSPMAKGAP